MFDVSKTSLSINKLLIGKTPDLSTVVIVYFINEGDVYVNL